MPREIKVQKPIPIPVALEYLEKRVEEEPLTDLTKRTYEYLRTFSKMDSKTARELVEKLVREGIKEEVAVMILNICPQSTDELRTILAYEKKFYSTEEVEKILSLIKDKCQS